MQDKERQRSEAGDEAYIEDFDVVEDEVSPDSIILAKGIILIRCSQSPWPPSLNTAEERRDWASSLMGPSASHLGASYLG